MVFVVCLVIFAGLAGVAVVSGREQGDLLQRMSCFLYKFFCIHRLPWVERQQVNTDLERLHPGMSGRELQMDYYVEKLRLVILVLFVGTLLTGLLNLKVWMETNLGAEASLKRGVVGEGERQVHLVAEVGGEREEVSVNVLERQLRDEELQLLFTECAEMLEGLMLGQNESLDHVSEDLELPDSVEGYPFEIRWKSSDTTRLGLDGEVQQEGDALGERIRLTATLFYGEASYEEEYLVQIVAVEKGTSLGRRLQEAIWKKDEESRYEEELSLPGKLGEETIEWTLVQENNSPIFLILTLVTAIGVYLLKDKDLHEQTLERKRSLKMAYPVILNKFVLYMGAGMTVRGAFLKIAGDYQRNQQTGIENAAYEELRYSCNELGAGVSEGLVYERFGKRSGLQEYARFAAMLGQNLKKGNSALLSRLREESEKAVQEDQQFRKKIGEEAETKLLAPMVMMMGIVMLLVMIPAFSAFE